MKHPLRFGLKLSGQDTTIEALRGVWEVADKGGFDHVWDFDHLASIGAVGPDRPIYEGWALQAAMAVATKRVRIGCNVSGNPYRHPGQLAKLAVTVDHLSGGRLEFGIGAGWAEHELRMLGLGGMENRVGRLEESLQVLKLLFTQERANYRGRYYRLEDAISNPKPIQKPYPPIWIGAGGDLMLKVVARHADVWNPTGGARGAGYSEANEKLELACQKIGRDSSTIRRCTILRFGGTDTATLIEDAAHELEQGFTEQLVSVEGPAAHHAAARVAEVLDQLRALAPAA